MTTTFTVFDAAPLTFAPVIAQQAAPPRGIETGQTATPANGQPLNGTPTGGGGAPQQQPGSPWIMLAPLLFLFVIMIFFSSRAQKKQKRQHEQMMSSLARHDRVETIGGIIGTIAELRDSEIVIKVDEATNTKIHVSKTAIKGVLKQTRRENADSAADA